MLKTTMKWSKFSPSIQDTTAIDHDFQILPGIIAMPKLHFYFNEILFRYAS